MKPRQRAERMFGLWGDIAFRRRGWIVVVMLLVTVGFGSRLPHVVVDTSTENWLLADDPVKVAYDLLREQFGRDQLVIVVLEPPEVFDFAFLAKLRELHRDFERTIPHLEEVTSLINVRSTYGRADELVVEDLLEEMPETEAELARLRDRVLSTPSYIDTVISEDGRVASLIIETDAYSSIGIADDDFGGFDEDPTSENGQRPFLTGEENAAIVEAVYAAIERFDGSDTDIRVSGSVLLPHELQIAMMREMPRFMGASLLVIFSLLFVLFRRFTPVILALGVVVLAVVSTLGLAELLGFKLTLSAQILPTFLLSVGVGYSVHLLSIYLQKIDGGDERREALVGALRHSGLPILMTGVTTMAGMLSFLVAELAPINEFGLVASMGVAMTLVYALFLLPAVLSMIRVRPRARGPDGALYERALMASGGFAARHPWPVVGVTLVLAIGSVAMATRIQFSSDPVAYLPPEHRFRHALDYVDERLGGSMTVEVIVDTGRENGLHDPEVLNRMDAIRKRVADYQAEGQVFRRTSSMLDVAKETHKALNENRSEFYAIPQSRQLLAQELLLFENSGSDDLERLVDSQFQIARLSIRTLWTDGYNLVDLVERSNREFREIMGDTAELTITGMSALITRSVRATVSSLIRSYGLALALITPLMMLLIGSLRSGLVSMVPNLVPIAMVMALMTLTGIKLDMFTLMFGCIAIGLAVDDTIHLIAGFRRYLEQTGDPIRSVDLTLRTTGRALLVTSVVLTAGFLVFRLSSMSNLRDFGLITAFAIAMAFVFDVLATPALLVLVTRGRGQKA